MSATAAAPDLYARVHARLAAAGQAHVLRFWHDLSPEQQQAFAASLLEIDYDELAAAFARATSTCPFPPLLPCVRREPCARWRGFFVKTAERKTLNF